MRKIRTATEITPRYTMNTELRVMTRSEEVEGLESPVVVVVPRWVGEIVTIILALLGFGCLDFKKFHFRTLIVCHNLS